MAKKKNLELNVEEGIFGIKDSIKEMVETFPNYEFVIRKYGIPTVVTNDKTGKQQLQLLIDDNRLTDFKADGPTIDELANYVYLVREQNDKELEVLDDYLTSVVYIILITYMWRYINKIAFLYNFIASNEDVMHDFFLVINEMLNKKYESFSFSVIMKFRKNIDRDMLKKYQTKSAGIEYEVAIGNLELIEENKNMFAIECEKSKLQLEKFEATEMLSQVLNQEEIKLIKEYYEDGKTSKTIAKEMEIARSTFYEKLKVIREKIYLF